MAVDVVEGTQEVMLKKVAVVVVVAAEDEAEITKTLMVWTLAIQIDYSYDMQQRDDRKRAIDKRITETLNKKRKTISVGTQLKINQWLQQL